MAFADAASRLSTLSIPTTIFHNCHSYSVSSSPASSPPTSSTAARRRAGPSQYTPPDDSVSSSSSSAYSTTGAFTTMPYAQQEPQARHQVQQPYPSPPPTMQAFQHSLPPLHQQQLPPLSSIVPQSSPFASHHRLQQQRIRTKSSGAAVARQHLPAVQPMLQADRTSHHTSAFAYPPYGQPGPSSQVKAPSSTSNMPTPSNGSVNGQQQQQQPPRMAQGRQQQQQHLAPTNHTPESGRTSRIANFVAHNTCAMICYIWFADPRPLTPASENPPATSSSSDPPASSSLNPYSPSFPAPQSNPTSARLQFCPTKQFTDFMHSLLTTTQVSQGVIVLSLCYIFRLKRQNPGIVAQPGSELRLAVVGLMLANKFLDDNTYTNLTWSQIAKIPLADINNMEREFLGGLGHQLFIDQKAYEGWLLMLNGLMWAKERAYDGWRRMMYGSAQASAMVSSTERGRNGASLVLAQATPNHRPHIHALPRARSTSPIPTTAPASAFPFTFTLPPLQQPSSNPFSAATTPTRPQYHHQLPPPQPQVPTQLQPPPIPTATRPTTAGSKRTLGDASFSPDLKPPPAKRPLSGSFAALADHAMTVAPQQQQQQPPRPAPLQPSYVATATAYNPQQHHHQHHHQTAQPAPSSYRIPSASEMLGIESHSNASSDDSRASSGIAEMPSSSMVTIGGYADGSGELRAALGRMSLEPSAVRGQDMVMVKQEEIDDVEEDEEDVDDVKEEDEDMMASHVRGESVVEHLIAPYHADEKLVSRGLPQYLTYHTLAASPSVMVDARQQAPQPVPAQSQAVVIPPPASSQEAHHAFGARDRGKTITRVQVNNFPVQYIQPPYMPVNSAANTTAFSIAPAGRTASFAHLGSRSARTSPTGLGFGSGVRGGFVGGMDVDSSYAPRHVFQPQRQVSMQRLQQQQQPSYPTAQQASSTVPSVSGAGHPRLPPLQTQHIIPPPATAAAATTTSSNNNHYHQPSHSHYASSPYANNHTNQAASYVNQPQGSFANAGPPGYQWPTNGSNGFFTGAAPNGSGHGNNNGYSAPTAAAVATPVHPFGDHHHYAPQSSQYGHQQDARWGYQQTQHLAQGQQAM